MSQQVTESASGLGSAAAAVVPASDNGSSRHLRLPALPSAVPWARRIVRHRLREWQLEEMADPALLLVSELVTNAVQASARHAVRHRGSWPMIGLALRLTDTAMMVEVLDTSPSMPAQEADLEGERAEGSSSWTSWPTHGGTAPQAAARSSGAR